MTNRERALTALARRGGAASRGNASAFFAHPLGGQHAAETRRRLFALRFRGWFAAETNRGANGGADGRRFAADCAAQAVQGALAQGAA